MTEQPIELTNANAEIPGVEMRGIHKHFGAVHALRGVDLKLMRNEVLGLVGDNAAGKSTLMKVLSGAYIPSEGEIYIEGECCHITKPEDSRLLGIEMVYQDFALANNLNVAANVFLGREVPRIQWGSIFSTLNKRYMEQRARELMDRLKIEIQDVRLKVERLSGGQRQAVAIARATAFDAKIMIMDEPTAALSVAAISKVLDLIMELKSQGASIIIISHRLEDIYHVADRVMVLRHGSKVGNLAVKDLSLPEFREALVARIIGAVDDFDHEEED